MTYFKTYVGALVAITVLDLLWLGVIAKPLYASQLADLLRPNIGITAAIFFYFLYPLGVVYFAVNTDPHAISIKLMLTGQFLSVARLVRS